MCELEYIAHDKRSEFILAANASSTQRPQMLVRRAPAFFEVFDNLNSQDQREFNHLCGVEITVSVLACDFCCFTTAY